jgi:uncharacterized membrane protein YfcA
MEFTLILGLVLIVFTAIFISATFGFGDALINMPLLTLLLGSSDTAPLVACLSMFNSGIIFFYDRGAADKKRLLPLLFSALLSMPLGFYVARVADEQAVKMVLGGLIMAFAIYNLFIKQMLAVIAIPSAGFDPKAIIFGTISGLFGGAYNISGPPVVLYGTLCAWSPLTFSATLQSFFFPLACTAVAMRANCGEYNSQIFFYLLIALPALILATLLGRYANSRITNPARFQRIIQVVLLFLGLSLFR